MGLVAGTLVEHHSFMVLPLRKYLKKHIGAKKNKKIIFCFVLKSCFDKTAYLDFGVWQKL